MKKEIGLFFVLTALLALLLGVLFGCLAAFNFIYPDFFRTLPFFKCRPLHVSLVVSWIFLSAIGGIYHYLPKHCGIALYSRLLPSIHFWTFIGTGIIILLCYLFGKFGGREYWEFPPLLAIPIILSWILFGFNYFKSVFLKVGQMPVYVWMWGTGILFFLFTFLESYLWIFPYFRNNIVRDITVQWKAYGALVGSWNMLVYGTAIFLMAKISKNEKPARSNLAFLMYALGLTNLMFGWAHHIYILPNAHWIRYSAYAISMTELLILAKIIRNWKTSMRSLKLYSDNLSCNFLLASEIWIFINLVLAICISIPAINIFTHGTHVTVAHAMGSTIGINTMILLGSVTFVVSDITGRSFSQKELRWFKAGIIILNASLLIFFLCLLSAGIAKGRMVLFTNMAFQQVMSGITPYLIAFAFSGLGLLTGIILIVFPLLRQGFTHLRFTARST
jgi:nitric oxide reductase subunit B